ncbi:MAG: hypothetical protein V4550_17610, partial [Gemmatimonadota bacterium]
MFAPVDAMLNVDATSPPYGSNPNVVTGDIRSVCVAILRAGVLLSYVKLTGLLTTSWRKIHLQRSAFMVW